MAVKLEIREATSRLTSLPPGLSEEISDKLSFEVPGYFFSRAYQSSVWDGKRRLFQPLTGEFSTGLVPRVLNILKEKDLEVEVADLRAPVTPRPFGDPLPLRNYQAEAVQKLLAEKRGIVHFPPRAGKTHVFLEVVRSLGAQSLFLSQSIDIVRQTFELARQYRIPVEMYSGKRRGTSLLTVGTIQSVWGDLSRKDPTIKALLSSARVVCYDEAHHAASSIARKVLRTSRAPCVFGLSATPWREDVDGMILEHAIGPVIYSTSYSDMIDQGYLVPPTFLIFKLPCPGLSYLSYQDAYAQYIVRNEYRNNIIAATAKRMMERGKSVAIIVARIEHGEILRDLIPNSLLLTGKDKDSARVNGLNALKEKKVIAISTLLDEGVDIPSLDGVIIAAGGKSAIKAMQRLRCLTPSQDKNSCVVIDFLDDAKYLRRHSKRRIALYKRERSFKVKMIDLRNSSSTV